MAYLKTLFISSLLIVNNPLIGESEGSWRAVVASSAEGDSAQADTLLNLDSLEVHDMGLAVADSATGDSLSIDSTTSHIAIWPDTGHAPYYQSIIATKNIGDYFWYRTGVMPLQNGGEGQSELLVKSVMLKGLDITYNGAPIYQQGYYIPFRGGADLNSIMFENVGGIRITPIWNLGLFTQGEELALTGMTWPRSDNPSSVTVAGGPYGYERSAWRFSRRFNQRLAGVFCASFKNSRGYYLKGADYDGFNVAGSLAAQPGPNLIVDYSFYQHNSKSGIMQFDRLVEPFLRLDRGLNYHLVNSRYGLTAASDINLQFYYQENRNFIRSDDNAYRSRTRDYLSGTKGSFNNQVGHHSWGIAAGADYRRLAGVGNKYAMIRTYGMTLTDSITLGADKSILTATRYTYDRLSHHQPAFSIKYQKVLHDSSSYVLSCGSHNQSPDLYPRYYRPAPVRPSTIGEIQINSYEYRPVSDLATKRTLFFSGEYVKKNDQNLALDVELVVGQTTNDLDYVTDDSSATWHTSPITFDYTFLTIETSLDYPISRYFRGCSGFTYVRYSQSGPKSPPALRAFSYGQFTLDNVLRGIDLGIYYQTHYVSRSKYRGFISIDLKRAYNLDGGLYIRFGDLEFRLTETNMLDFITGNEYNIWGNYRMPPGNVWWQLTWNFGN